MLTLLSSGQFEKFKEENFDLELLVEVLYDLLCTLPNALIPNRYLDLFMCLAEDYRSCLSIFAKYLARSHFTLFELLIRFLQIYSKCLNSCDSVMNSMIASAMFKIAPSRKEGVWSAGTQGDKVVRDAETANKLVRLFVESHTEFAMI